MHEPASEIAEALRVLHEVMEVRSIPRRQTSLQLKVIMIIKQLTDGMVMDRVAEFLYYPSTRLRELYAADRVNYVDALCKFIQITATTDHLAMSASSPNEEMGRLKESLGDLVDVNALSFSVETVEERRAMGLCWIKENWNEIDETVLMDLFSAKTLNGHVQREFYRCFLLPEDKRQSMAHYVGPDETLPLHRATMNLLLSGLAPTVRISGVGFDQAFIEDWVRRTVTTHYRVFAEYGLSYRHQYAPSGTRSQIPILKKLPEEEALETVTRCIAADILAELVERGGRRALVDVIRDWHTRQKAEKVRRGYSDLVDKFEFLPVAGRQELVADINGILETEKGFAIDLAMGSANALVQAMKLQNPKGSDAMNSPRALRWLYSVRRPNAAHELFSLVDELVEAA